MEMVPGKNRRKRCGEGRKCRLDRQKSTEGKWEILAKD